MISLVDSEKADLSGTESATAWFTSRLTRLRGAEAGRYSVNVWRMIALMQRESIRLFIKSSTMPCGWLCVRLA